MPSRRVPVGAVRPVRWVYKAGGPNLLPSLLPSHTIPEPRPHPPPDHPPTTGLGDRFKLETAKFLPSFLPSLLPSRQSLLVLALAAWASAICLHGALAQAPQSRGPAPTPPPAGTPAPATPAPGTAEALPAGYREAIDQAIAEYQARNFAEARALFMRAHELYPNARTLRGLGMMEFELRNYVESLARLEQALASQVKPLDAELRAQTEQLLARVRRFVASYELTLQPLPEQVRVLVDGVPVAYAVGQVLTLAVGEHTLQVQAQGYRDEKRKLSIKGGERMALTIPLHPVPRATATASAEVSNEAGESSLLGPGLTIGGGVLAATGLVLGALALGSAQDAQSESDADSARTQALAADISMGLGLAAAAVGVYFWFLDERAPSPATSGGTTLRIGAGPDTAFVQAGLRF